MRDPDDLRLFASFIDWAAAERSKELYWRDWKRKHGPAFGAQAAVAYGRPRMTADVDVTVDLGQESPFPFLDELSRAGFELRIDLGEDFLREARLLLERIRELLGELEVALGDERLLRRFERIARKAR